MPTDPEYERWATQHAHIDAQQIQVLQFAHPKWGSLWLSDYGIDWPAMTEDGLAFTALAVAFTVELPKSGNSTQQELLIRMDALGGQVISQIRAFTDAERRIPIIVTYRVYLDSQPGAPVTDPLEFLALDVSATRLAVELRCAATILPNVAAGVRYTIDRFPTLAYL